MTIQLSVLCRDARLNAIETYGGTDAVLKLWTGAQPATPETADSGTLVAAMTLPSDWMAAASSASKAKAGTWEDTSADNPGTVGHFRLYKSDGSTVIMQGSVTITGSGGDMTLDNNVVVAGQSISITTFALTGGNP